MPIKSLPWLLPIFSVVVPAVYIYTDISGRRADVPVEVAEASSLAALAPSADAPAAARQPAPAGPETPKAEPAKPEMLQPKNAYEAHYHVRYALDAVYQKLRARDLKNIDYDFARARWGVENIGIMAATEGERRKRLNIVLKQLGARIDKMEQATAKSDFTQAEYEHKNAAAALKEASNYLQ